MKGFNTVIGGMAAGHAEEGDNNLGPHVARYLKRILAPPADWCAGFVSWCFKNSGQPMPYPYSRGARDVLKKLRGAAESRSYGVMEEIRESIELPVDR